MTDFRYKELVSIVALKNAGVITDDDLDRCAITRDEFNEVVSETHEYTVAMNCSFSRYETTCKVLESVIPGWQDSREFTLKRRPKTKSRTESEFDLSVKMSKKEYDAICERGESWSMM